MSHALRESKDYSDEVMNMAFGILEYANFSLPIVSLFSGMGGRFDRKLANAEAMYRSIIDYMVAAPVEELGHNLRRFTKIISGDSDIQKLACPGFGDMKAQIIGNAQKYLDSRLRERYGASSVEFNQV